MWASSEVSGGLGEAIAPNGGLVNLCCISIVENCMACCAANGVDPAEAELTFTLPRVTLDTLEAAEDDAAEVTEVVDLFRCENAARGSPFSSPWGSCLSMCRRTYRSS